MDKGKKGVPQPQTGNSQNAKADGYQLCAEEHGVRAGAITLIATGAEGCDTWKSFFLISNANHLGLLWCILGSVDGQLLSCNGPRSSPVPKTAGGHLAFVRGHGLPWPTFGYGPELCHREKTFRPWHKSPTESAEEDSNPGTPRKDIWRNVSAGCKWRRISSVKQDLKIKLKMWLFLTVVNVSMWCLLNYLWQFFYILFPGCFDAKNTTLSTVIDWLNKA